MPGNRKKISSGMTLIEALIATIILSGSILAVGAISTRCLNSVKDNQEYETAWQLVNNQFGELKSVEISKLVSLDDISGEFDGYDNFRWQAKLKSHEIDGLYEIMLDVSWLSRGILRSVSAKTLVFESQNTAEEDNQQ